MVTQNSTISENGVSLRIGLVVKVEDEGIVEHFLAGVCSHEEGHRGAKLYIVRPEDISCALIEMRVRDGRYLKESRSKD